MPSLGPLEMLVVATLALVVFGPQRLPEIARTIGRVVSEFRRQANELTSEFKSGIDFDLEDDEDDAEEPARPFIHGASAKAEASADDLEASPTITRGAESAPPAAEPAGETPVLPAAPGSAGTRPNGDSPGSSTGGGGTAEEKPS